MSGLKAALGDRMNGIPLDPEDDEIIYQAGTPEYEPYADEQTSHQCVPHIDDYSPEAYNKLILAKVKLPVSATHQHGTVRRRKWDHDGNMVGNFSKNPQQDTTMYEVEFTDGYIESYAANIIAESIYEKLDDEGNQFRLIEEIIEHKKDSTAITSD